jgi:antitoxin HicB
MCPGLYTHGSVDPGRRMVLGPQAIERQVLTKAALAEKMETSRAQVDCILKAKGNVTIESLARAAAVVGRQLRVELV